MSSNNRPTRSQQREEARAKAKSMREQHKKSERRKGVLIKATIGLAVVAAAAIIASVVIGGLSGNVNSNQNGTPLNGISFNGTTYIAVGELGSVLTSTNAVNWIDRGADTVINGYDLSSIAYGNGFFRAVGLTTEVGVGPNWDQAH